MITVENYLGTMKISKEYLVSLISHTVSNCFGVADINSAESSRGLLNLFKKADMTNKNCVNLSMHNGKLIVTIHISVSFGTNISAVTDSLVHKVRYTVEDKTGVKISKISIFIDGIKN